MEKRKVIENEKEQAPHINTPFVGDLWGGKDHRDLLVVAVSNYGSFVMCERMQGPSRIEVFTIPEFYKQIALLREQYKKRNDKFLLTRYCFDEVYEFYKFWELGEQAAWLYLRK